MEKCMLIFSMHFFVQYQFPFQGIMVFLSDFFFFFIGSNLIEQINLNF